MKHRIWILIIAFICTLTYAVNASACDYAKQVELSEEAANIKFVYEEATGMLPESVCTYPNCDRSYTYFKIKILNLSENFYIQVKNNVNKDEKYFYYSDNEDGVISFDWKDMTKVTKLTYNVYSSSATPCSGESYYIGYFTIPRYNSYSEYLTCQEHAEHELCAKYVTFDEISQKQFADTLEKYDQEKEEEENNPINKIKTFFENVLKFLSDNIVVITIVLALVAGVVVVYVYIRKKNRR